MPCIRPCSIQNGTQYLTIFRFPFQNIQITWDHGPEGSIAEDAFFAIIAMSKGFKFGFIPGEMGVKWGILSYDNYDKLLNAVKMCTEDENN